jgi:hypothetical protein
VELRTGDAPWQRHEVGMNNHRVPRRSSVRCSVLGQPRFKSTGGQLPYPGPKLLFGERRLGDE